MVVTDYARNQISLFITGSNTSAHPQYFIIGSGSGASSVSDTELVYSVDRQEFTSGTNTALQKLNFLGDWNSVEMSGIQLRQFGNQFIYHDILYHLFYIVMLAYFLGQVWR